MAATFFELQARARKRTNQLVFLYACAVLMIILAVYIVVYLIWSYGSYAPSLPYPDPDYTVTRPSPFAPNLFEPWLFIRVAMGTGLVILLGSLYKVAALRGGGPSVAKSLGGRIVDLSTQDADERKALNVVEEMAIASGIPVPPLFILDKEAGINAFAAGFTPSDAVIGLTRGCITELTRDELQGVVGHEFSHILNGDMRLNIRLIGILFGILLIGLLGRTLMRASGNSRSGSKGSGSALVLTGLGLFVIGYVGVFFGRLIKSAVSRQREYLADASSVQFTRNPTGLAGALKKILGIAQGSKLETPNAEQTSHMFFAEGMSHFFSFLFATHPPLSERIKRIDPSFAEEVEIDGPREQLDNTPQALVSSIGRPRKADLTAASAILGSFENGICDTARNELGARALIMGLLLSTNSGRLYPSQEDLYGKLGPDLSMAVHKLGPDIDKIKPEHRMALVDMCMPALRRMTLSEYQSFREQIQWLTHLDKKMSFFEYTLGKVVIRNLDALFVGKPQRRVRFRKLEEVQDSCIDLLSHLAVAGGTDLNADRQAFLSSILRINPSLKAELPDPRSLSLEKLDGALKRLEISSLEIREKVMEAAACCIACDGVINVNERELIRAIGSHLDCPVPPGGG